MMMMVMTILSNADNTDKPVFVNSKTLYLEDKGICQKCKRTDTNPMHRPTHAAYAYCPECMEKMDREDHKRRANELKRL